MLALILLSSLVGLSLVRFLPWKPSVRAVGIPLAFALAAAPFLAGLSTVIVLMSFPGCDRKTHLIGVFSLLAAAGLASTFFRPIHAIKELVQPNSSLRSKWNWLLGALLTIWTIGFSANAFLFPITQNDALEYATVGRLLFELHDLSAYPALNPLVGSSGFFGPWTHPPLYVSMAYFTNLIQGHANTPGLMSIITPWFALSATLLIFTLGCLANRTTGLVAALIFLSTPLFYLSASSALIDALPVSGIALLFCSIIAVDGSPVRKGLIQGLILGVALWTHSQAILFIPISFTAIVFYNGWKGCSAALKQIITLSMVAGFTAAWPYWHNLQLFGSLISDNPAVFALEKLEWANYFRLARGLGSWPEKFQNGLFKGWFALRSFSISYWAMTFGVALYLFKLRKNDHNSTSERWKISAIGIMLCYFGGVILSIFLGIDLMIRNERYLLILTPFVALFAGIGISEITKFRRSFSLPLLSLFLIFLSVQFLVVGSHKMRSLSLYLSDLFLPHEEKLKGWPDYAAVDFLSRNTPQASLVLSLKPADMYYAHRRMISYLDPRLLPFYYEEDPHRALEQLKALGIRYLHIPDYSLPSIYNSELQEILSRDDLSKLIFSEEGYQIYEIGQSDLSTFERPDPTNIDINAIPVQTYKSPILRWDLVTYLWHRPKDAFTNSPQDNSPLIAIRPGSEYRVSLSLNGHAFVRIRLLQYDAEDRLINKNLIGEIAMDKLRQGTRFLRRFRANARAASARITVEPQGKSDFQISEATIALLNSR